MYNMHTCLYMCLRRSTRIEAPGWLENSPKGTRAKRHAWCGERLPLPPHGIGTRRASSALQREVIQRRAILTCHACAFRELHQPPPRADPQLSKACQPCTSAVHRRAVAAAAPRSHTHAPAPPRHRPALRLHHTHRRRHRCSLCAPSRMCPRTLPLLPHRAAQPRLTRLPPTNPNLRSRSYTSLDALLLPDR